MGAECSQQALLDIMGGKSVSPNWVCCRFKAGSVLDVAPPQTLCAKLVQDTQFQIAVHFNVVHIVFFYQILYLFTSHLFNAEQCNCREIILLLIT